MKTVATAVDAAGGEPTFATTVVALFSRFIVNLLSFEPSAWGAAVSFITIVYIHHGELGTFIARVPSTCFVAVWSAGHSLSCFWASCGFASPAGVLSPHTIIAT